MPWGHPFGATEARTHVRVCFARKAGSNVFSSCAARRVALATVLLVAGPQGSRLAEADTDTRTISLYHVHTQENLTITYKKHGHYD
jgi:hypothetical protein